ncbi:RWD domain-containing protein 1 [Vitis vinifera]|uniref:RWD domain-containing protein 1 n=1 Tax=Vitis vinifera TaxID=29760 RepID=A0A438K7D8_VITVI|nr:RWD domain-containing protein 1 [Vitis vinifera]
MCVFHLSTSTDYVQEQEMEIEALQAILMDDFKEIDPSESGLNTSNRCFQITLSPQEDEADVATTIPVQLALIFSHTEKYPDEPPHLNLKSLRGIQYEDLRNLKEKLEQEASENLGMAMVYTLVTSAQEWLSERFGQDANVENSEEEETEKDDCYVVIHLVLVSQVVLEAGGSMVLAFSILQDENCLKELNVEREENGLLPIWVIIVPHGEPVTVETFLAWRERFEAELALERAKLMPESALTAPKEKKLSGRQWFESGRAVAKGAVPVNEESDEEDDEDIDFDDDDFEDDEEDMLEHYLAEKSDSSAHSSRRAN